MASTLSIQRKTLYVLPTCRRDIEADSTDRLTVTHPRDGHLMAIPARHLLRVVANAHVNFSGRALQLCATAGVTIALQNATTTWAYVLPAARREDSMSALLAILMEEPSWREDFVRWKENQRLAAASRAALACGLGPGTAIRRDARAALCSAHQQKFGSSCSEWVDALASIARQGFIAQAMQSHGLPRNPALAERAMEVYSTIADIAALSAHVAVHHRGRVPESVSIATWAMQSYERNRSLWLEQGERLLLQFETLLREHC